MDRYQTCAREEGPSSVADMPARKARTSWFTEQCTVFGIQGVVIIARSSLFRFWQRYRAETSELNRCQLVPSSLTMICFFEKRTCHSATRDWDSRVVRLGCQGSWALKAGSLGLSAQLGRLARLNASILVSLLIGAPFWLFSGYGFRF
jgi:hypothetical protein